MRHARANPGKFKALGVTVEDRITALPDVPALSDAPELKGFHVTTSIGLFVPANTPTAITERLNKELNDILASPDLRKTFEDQAARVGKGSGAEFTLHSKDVFQHLAGSQGQISTLETS